MILQTAPAGRLSVGELMGEEPGKTDIKKVVAAAHSIGFDFVFDTTFSADTCATLEAEELVDRVRENGPFPMVSHEFLSFHSLFTHARTGESSRAAVQDGSISSRRNIPTFARCCPAARAR